MDKIRGWTPVPKFDDESYFENSPEIEKALNAIIDKLNIPTNEMMLITTPRNKKGFFWDMWNKNL